MFTLTYAGIPLQFEAFTAYELTPVMSGPDKLFNQHDIHIVGLFTPGRNSFLPAGKPGAVPAIAPFGLSRPVGVSTFNNIRDLLLTPQQSLTLTVDSGVGVQVGQVTSTTILSFINTVVAQDNNTYQTSDQALGPFPLYCNIHEVVGTKTFIVQYGVRISVNETNAVSAVHPALLSNRWTQSQQLDNRFWSKIITQGRAVFDPARLAFLVSKPDNFRNFFGPPSITGYKREVVQVEVSEDGRIVHYTVVDEERPVGVLPSNIADIDLVVSVGKNLSPLMSRITSTIQQTVNIAAAVSLVAASKAGLVANLLRAGVSTVGSAASLAETIPQVTQTIELTVYGMPQATLKQLLAPSLATVAGLLPGAPGWFHTVPNDGTSSTVRSLTESIGINVSVDFKHKIAHTSIVVKAAKLGKIQEMYQVEPDGVWPDWGVTRTEILPQVMTSRPVGTNNIRMYGASPMSGLITQFLQQPGLAAGPALVPIVAPVTQANSAQ